MHTKTMAPFLRSERTLRTSAKVDGVGYWSGRKVRVEFHPAPPGTGIVFVRIDRPHPVRIPVNVKHRMKSSRRTTLLADGCRVEMVEHVLAALAGLQIDNCEVFVDQPEMPGCDGSSLQFVIALDAAGIETQRAARRTLVVQETFRVGTDEAWIEARPPHSNTLSVKYRLQYANCPAIGEQDVELAVTPDAFRRELASSRTFLLKDEAEWLNSQGLGNQVTHQDLLVFDDHGPIDNPLRFSNECARHKALDLVGDLALSGCDVLGHLVAFRSGHHLNASLVAGLLNAEGAAEGWQKSA